MRLNNKPFSKYLFPYTLGWLQVLSAFYREFVIAITPIDKNTFKMFFLKFIFDQWVFLSPQKVIGAHFYTKIWSPVSFDMFYICF